MTRRGRRLVGIGAAAGVLALALALVLVALQDRIVFFYSPTELQAKASHPGTRIRLGGLVEAGSVKRNGDGTVSFVITDTSHTVPVSFSGSLPDLFREGQGIVAEGTLTPEHVFRAETVLAKHDETYMPKEVADALKAQGVWQGNAPVAGEMR